METYRQKFKAIIKKYVEEYEFPDVIDACDEIIIRDFDYEPFAVHVYLRHCKTAKHILEILRDRGRTINEDAIRKTGDRALKKINRLLLKKLRKEE